MKLINATTSPKPAAFITDRRKTSPTIKVYIPDQWMTKENVKELCEKLLAEFN